MLCRACSATYISASRCWAEAPVKIARMTLTIKLDGNWSSFQLANNTPPLSVTGSVIAPSARMSWRRRETTCAGHSLGRGCFNTLAASLRAGSAGPLPYVQLCQLGPSPTASAATASPLLPCFPPWNVHIVGSSSQAGCLREILLWMTPSEAPRRYRPQSAVNCSTL